MVPQQADVTLFGERYLLEWSPRSGLRFLDSDPVAEGAAAVLLDKRSALADFARYLEAELAAGFHGSLEERLDRLTHELGQLEEASHARIAQKLGRTQDPVLLACASHSGNDFLRAAVAANRFTPASVLEQMVSDPEPRVRTALAYNPSLPDSAVSVLARDENPRVKLVLASSGRAASAWMSFTTDPDEELRSMVARHPDTPEEMLVLLVSDSSEDVVRELTRRRHLPPAIAAKLRSHPNAQIRFQMRCHDLDRGL